MYALAAEQTPLSTERTPPAEAPPKHVGIWKRVIGLVALAAALIALVVSDAAHAGLIWMLDLTEPVIAGRPVIGAIVFILLSAASAMVAFFSSAVFVPLALETWGMRLTGLLLWTGWTLGGAGAYAIGRYLGRPVVTRFASDTVLARYEHWVSARAPFGLVLLFLLALQSEVPGYVLGLARYSLARYMLAVALVEVPFTLITLSLGSSLLERRLLVLLGAGAAALLLSGLALIAFRQRLRKGAVGPATEEDARDEDH